MNAAGATVRSRILPGKQALSAVAQFLSETHGLARTTFAPLVKRFGKAAALDVIALEKAVSAPALQAQGAVAGDAWGALERLAQRARGLPGDERDVVLVALQHRAETLLAKQDDFGRLYAADIADIAAKRAQARLDKLAKAGLSIPAASKLNPGKVISRLHKDLAAAEPGLRQLWNLFHTIVAVDSAWMQRAAQIAAAQAPRVAQLLKSNSPAAREELMALLVNVRGELGEGYALLNKVYRARKAGHVARAEQLALQLGKGHKVLPLTQTENIIKINGLPGPDDVVFILTPDKLVLLASQAEVKVALASEGVAQTISGVLRRGGQRGSGMAKPTVSFARTPGGPIEHFLLAVHDKVETTYTVINAAGSKIPGPDLDELARFGITAEELKLDVSIEQFTHLAASLMDAAVNALKSANVP